jgi:regulator of sigma E protease
MKPVRHASRTTGANCKLKQPMLIYLLLIVMIFSAVAVLLVHEVGHFLVAQWFGIRVLSLSVGIGPELFGFTDRYGTRWSFSLLPIGGYLKLDQTDLFNCAAQNSSDPSRRAAVYAAGPVANVILFLVVYTLSWAFFGGPHDLFHR